MALQITPNPRATGTLSITANAKARMSSIISVTWANVTGKPGALAGLGSLTTGLIAITDLIGGSSSRAVTGTGNEITVTNGDGVSGNPTVSLPAALTFTGKTVTGGTFGSPTINSATMVTPALGTPASGIATNLTGTASGLTAGNVTTNANLTGPITSSGNATAIASQTGTGTKFVVDTSPTITTPTFTSSTEITGIAPAIKFTETDNSNNNFTWVLDSGVLGLRYNGAFPGILSVDSVNHNRVTVQTSNSAPNDFATFFVSRTANHTGGTPGRPNCTF